MDADESLSSFIFYLEFLCLAINVAPKNQINVFVPSVGRNLRAATSSSVISSFKTIKSWKSETCRDTFTWEAAVVTVSAPTVDGVFGASGGYLSSAARLWRRSRLPARRWWPLRSSAQRRSSSVSPGNGQYVSSSWNRHPLPVLETTHCLFIIIVLSFSNLKKKKKTL